MEYGELLMITYEDGSDIIYDLDNEMILEKYEKRCP
jgi:hypothetical protein